MKRNFLIVLAASLLLSLTACGSSGDSSTTETSTTETSTAAESSISNDASDSSGDEPVVKSSYEEGTPAAQLADLFNGGYAMGTSTGIDKEVVVYFNTEDHKDFKQVTCTMTDEQNNAYFSLDCFAEDYYQQCFDILAASDDLTITTPEIPDISEYEAMEGKTIGEMEEEAGLESAGVLQDANEKPLVNLAVCAEDGTTYTIQVTPDVAEDDDTFYDDDSVKDLTVKKVVFWEFG